MPFVVLVTGSREWPASAVVWRELDALRQERGPLIVRHGACSSGADWHAHLWCSAERAERRHVLEQRRPARWTQEGRAAGPKRNARMLVELPVPRVVLAFPLLCPKPVCRFMADGPHWTHGTKDMIERAEIHAGLRVRTFRPD